MRNDSKTRPLRAHGKINFCTACLYRVDLFFDFHYVHTMCFHCVFEVRKHNEIDYAIRNLEDYMLISAPIG